MSFQLFHGDCLEVLRGLPDDSVDSVCTDPPYGLKFMGHRWDCDVPSVDVWREVFRVLKPGGHLLSFSGTRTYHRMVVNIEDAGFEIRDQIMWVYGCLDTQTQVATIDGVKHYHETKVGDLVLCYNPENGEYCYQPILEIVEYDYRDTAYRLVGDFGEQVVSRNHRVIIERGGIEAFQLAETLECEARVPVLESLPALQQTLRDTRQGSGCSEQDVQQGLCELVDRENQLGSETVGGSQGQNRQVCGVRAGVLETGRMVAQDRNPDVQQGVQRRTSGAGVGETLSQGAVELAPVVGSGPQGADDWRKQPRMEGRVDLQAAQGCVCRSVDQIRPMPAGIFTDGESGRVCDGASGVGGECDCTDLDTDGSCAPHKPRCDGQPIGESDAVCHKRTAQGVRAWGGHKTAVVRVVPFHYTGKVWCLRVPTGAFVAVRDGVAFPTGNSGFPKSLDVSKAIDKAAGAEREVVGVDTNKVRRQPNTGFSPVLGKSSTISGGNADITAPATPEAEQWQGWGTALKPAHEPICVARKPLSAKTVAANVILHGTGAINIDACRVELQGESDAAEFENNHRVTERLPESYDGELLGLHDGGWKQRVGAAVIPTGRWPANLMHDGSDEVVSAFPDSKGQQGTTGKRSQGNCFSGVTADGEGVPPRNDTGSAARFFYSSKASKKDRNSGCEGVLSWENVDLSEQIQSALSHLKGTSGIITSLQVDSECGMTWFGSNTSEQYLTDTMFIIETVSKLITELTTLNFCQSSITRESILVAIRMLRGHGLNLAESAENISLSIVNITSEKMGSALGAVVVLLKTLSEISEKGKPGNIHSTVKPTDVCRWLLRLVTPPGGTSLDLYCGSGSFGVAAIEEGFNWIGIDLDQDKDGNPLGYIDIARSRCIAAQCEVSGL